MKEGENIVRMSPINDSEHLDYLGMLLQEFTLQMVVHVNLRLQ